METITLEHVYYIGQTVGVIVVIASLVFVGLQVRQNARAIRVNMAHCISTEWVTLQATLATDRELSAIAWKALQEVNNVGPDEKMRFYVFMHASLLALSDAYFQYRQGMFSPDAWFGFRQYWINLSELPGFRAYWSERRYIYPESFRSYFEKEILEKPAVAGWKLAGT